jgi:Uma2 family endonuclease
VYDNVTVNNAYDTSLFLEPSMSVSTIETVQIPRRGEWSEEAYLALKTNQLVELNDGWLEVLPVPSILHQLIVDFLHSLLKAFIGGQANGLVLFAPLPIRLSPGSFREPDIVFLRPERVSDRRQPPQGADLVMEVVSDGSDNRERDYEIKREAYARAGIAEYWIVDPQQRRITVLTLDGNGYRVHGEFAAGTTATSVMFPAFKVDVSSVFVAGEGA